MVGSATLKDKNGTVLATVSPMFVPNSGFNFTLYDFPVAVGTPATPEGVLVVHADNPSGLPENDFIVTVPLTFGRTLLSGASYGGFTTHKVVAGDTLSGIAHTFYNDANAWPRLFTANRDRISDPDLIRIGQVLRVPPGRLADVQVRVGMLGQPALFDSFDAMVLEGDQQRTGSNQCTGDQAQDQRHAVLAVGRRRDGAGDQDSTQGDHQQTR